MSQSEHFETATLAGGCFWCLEAVFLDVEGVKSVVSGYTGGTSANPTYEKVCAGETGHAETVQVTFDPDKISYREILEIFFSVHDPTTLNRQGADIGTQYRSAIYYHDELQKETADKLVNELNKEKIWSSTIVTRIMPLSQFYSAEDYHQNYYSRHPEQGYCQVVISPKVSKFRQKWANKLKK